MIRDPKAYAKSQTKKQTAFDNKVKIALEHLPHVLRNKYDGMLTANSRDSMRDMLIADGVLGARWNAKHVAHAKKHKTPLEHWHQRAADSIIDNMIQRAVDKNMIEFSSGPQGFKIELLIEVEENSAEIAEFEDDLAIDVDDKYPLSENLAPHLARDWQLSAAHE